MHSFLSNVDNDTYLLIGFNLMVFALFSAIQYLMLPEILRQFRSIAKFRNTMKHFVLLFVFAYVHATLSSFLIYSLFCVHICGANAHLLLTCSTRGQFTQFLIHFV